MDFSGKSAVLELTFNCNHSCLFCYLPWLEEPSMYAPELDIDCWIAAAERLISGGVERFTLSGGEPLLKAGIFRLIDFLTSHPAKPVFSVYTNGLLISDELLDRLAGTEGSLSVSLPGVKSFQALTGSPMDVYGWIDRMDRVKKAGVNFSVGITVTKRSLKELKQMVSLAALAGAEVIQIGPVMIEGRMRYHPELSLTYDEIVKLNRDTEKLAKHIKVPVRCDGELFCSCREGRRCVKPEGLPADYMRNPCSVDEHLIVIDPAGKLRKCLHTFEPTGDLRDFF